MLCTTQSSRNRKLPESPVVRMVFKSLKTSLNLSTFGLKGVQSRVA